MNANVNRNVSVLLQDVLLSYAYLAQPYAGKNDDGSVKLSYVTHAIYKPGSANHIAMSEAMRKTAAIGWGAQAEAVLLQLKGQDRLCQHDGNISKGGAEPYKDMLFVSASNSRRPRILVTRGGVNVEIGADDPMFPYSGCRANVMIDLWPQSADGKPNKFGKRINATLTGLQFVAHGEPLSGGGRIATPDEFPNVETSGADAPAPSAAPGGSSLI